MLGAKVARELSREDQMATENNNLETLLSEHDVKHITGLSLASIRRWRLNRRGPRFLKLGSAVRYRREDINAWLASLPTGGSSCSPNESAAISHQPDLPAQTARRG